MEQSGDEDRALSQLNDAFNPSKLYASMIDIVMSKRSISERKSIETLFSWCTYAKEELSIYEIQQIWKLDHSLREFDVKSEIEEGKSKRYILSVRSWKHRGCEAVRCIYYMRANILKLLARYTSQRKNHLKDPRMFYGQKRTKTHLGRKQLQGLLPLT